MTQNEVKWRDFVSVVLNIRVILRVWKSVAFTWRREPYEHN